MTIGSLFLWFVGGWVFSAVFYLPLWGARVIKSFLATAANDIKGS